MDMIYLILFDFSMSGGRRDDKRISWSLAEQSFIMTLVGVEFWGVRVAGTTGGFAFWGLGRRAHVRRLRQLSFARVRSQFHRRAVRGRPGMVLPTGSSSSRLRW